MSITQGLGIIVAGAAGSLGRTSKSSRKIGPIIANITISERHHDEMEITDHPVQSGAVISDHVYKRPAEVTLIVGWSNSPPGSTGSILGDIRQALVNKLTGSLQNAITGAAQKAIGGSAIGNLAVAKLGELVGGKLTSLGASINTGTGKGTTKVQDVYASLLDLMTKAEPFTIYTGKRVYRDMVIKAITTETDIKTENALVAQVLCRQILIAKTQIVSVTAPADQQKAPEKTAATTDQGTKQPAEVSDTQKQIALQKAWSKS